MRSNFTFLEKDFPVLANFGQMAEKYCFSDPNSCLMNARRNHCQSHVYL